MDNTNNKLPGSLSDYIILLEKIRDNAIITAKNEFAKKDDCDINALQKDLINAGYESIDHFFKVNLDIRHQITEYQEKENLIEIECTDLQKQPIFFFYSHEKTLELMFKKVLVLFNTKSRPLIEAHLDNSAKQLIKRELKAFILYNENESLKKDPFLQEIIKYINDSLEPHEEIFSHLKIPFSNLIKLADELEREHYIDSSKKFVASVVKGIAEFNWLNNTVTSLMLVIISICKESAYVPHLNVLKAIHKPSAANRNSGQNLKEFKAKLDDPTFAGRKYPQLTSIIAEYV